MNRIPVALFSSSAKAGPLKQRLVQAGIQAEVHEELRLEKLWFVSKSSAGARLDAPANQFERACQLLLEWDMAEGALRDAVEFILKAQGKWKRVVNEYIGQRSRKRNS